MAYLVGRKEFYSLALEVSPAVLIPRPESEFVVVEFLELARSHGSTPGRRCRHGIGLPGHRLHASASLGPVRGHRLFRGALAVARKNAGRHGVADRIDFRLGDLLEPVAAEPPFDLIVSNPPYIPTDVIPTLEPGVRDHEPHSALDGGPDGLRVVARLIEQRFPCSSPADT